MGHMVVLPGCGSLYRVAHLGTIEEGPLKQYFEILDNVAPGDGIVLGNLRLAEDRILPGLLTFLSKKDCHRLNVHQPKLAYLPCAVSYVEAEYPLEMLVKQRRRWTNGAVFRSLWVMSTSACARAYLFLLPF